nr:hypothetical protein [Raoultella terrigena]
MNKSILLVLLLLFPLFSQSVFSEDKSHDVIWMYEKISDADVFGKRDANAINSLGNIYSKVTINVGEKKLNINNDFLEDGHVCSIDYVNITKTPLSYFLSQKTVSMYEQFFTREGFHLSKSLSIFESIFPDQSCPPPYDELIKSDDRLIVIDQSYVLFFKAMKSSSNTGAVDSEKGSLSKYCHNKKDGHIYDGSSTYICNFDGLNLKGAYGKVIMLNGFSRKYMKRTLPMENDAYKIDESTISYKWESAKLLTVSVSMSMDGEMTKYNFDEQSSGTRVEILGSTQY